MTEEEWLGAKDFASMLDFLQDKVSDRKLRLFACACSRRIGNSLTEDAQQLVAFAEDYADGHADCASRRRLATSDFLPEGIGLLLAVEIDRRTLDLHTEAVARVLARREVSFPTPSDGSVKYMRAVKRVLNSTKWKTAIQNERREQSRLLLEVAGLLPFRAIPFDTAWRTPPVTALAEVIYRERAFDRLPNVADVLEEAGCDNQDILTHCRQPGEHVRGCWVIDLLTGRK